MSISFQREFLRDLRVLSHSLLASQSRCDSVPHNLEGYQGLSAISPALGLAHILKLLEFLVPFSQFTRSVMSDSLQPHGLQHARLPCPSPTSRVCSNSCPSGRWCHPAISSSVVPFSSCLQSFPALGSFPRSQFFSSRGQSIGVSAPVLPMNIQDCFPLGLTGLIFLKSKGLSRVYSNTTVQKHQFSGLSFLHSPTLIYTWLLEKPWLWLDGHLFIK